MDNELYHYGIKRRSGRYPYGSGERPFQRDKPYKNTVSTGKRDKYYEKDRTIPKGTKMYRVSFDNSPIGKDSVYVTYTKIDRDGYKSVFFKSIKKNTRKRSRSFD